MFQTSFSCFFAVVFSNTHYFVSEWLLLHVHASVDVLDFVIVLFQNGVLKYMLFVSACMLLHVYSLVDVLGFVFVSLQSGVFEHFYGNFSTQPVWVNVQ